MGLIEPLHGSRMAEGFIWQFDLIIQEDYTINNIFIRLTQTHIILSLLVFQKKKKQL